jgi:hypothetical protein
MLKPNNISAIFKKSGTFSQAKPVTSGATVTYGRLIMVESGCYRKAYAKSTRCPIGQRAGE